MGYERNGGRYDRGYGERRYGRDDYRDRDRERGYGPPRDGRDSYAREGYRGPPGDYDYDDRGFFDRAGDEVRSWFGDEEAERRRRWDERLRQREYERRYGEGGRFADPALGYGYGLADGGLGLGYYGGPGLGDSYGAGRGAGATSTFGLGAGRDHDGWGRDPDYHAWRTRQLQDLDRDYDEYRRENQSRFNDDFGSWRTNRQGQRQSIRQAQEHQEVVGSDGVHVGKVDHVRGDRILLTKSDKDAGGHHHSIPSSWIVEVGDKIRINRTAAQAQAAWKDEERSEGPHNLNRAFSGTY